MTIRTEKCRPRCSEIKKKANFSFFGSKQFSSKSRKKERKRRVRGRKGAIIRR